MGTLNIEVDRRKELGELIVPPSAAVAGIVSLKVRIDDAGPAGVWPHADSLAQDRDADPIVLDDVVPHLRKGLGSPDGLVLADNLIGSRHRLLRVIRARKSGKADYEWECFVHGT